MAIELEIKFVPEVLIGSHGGFTAICHELQLAASGDQEQEARLRLRGIVTSYCNALQRQGLLEKVLTESGIRWSQRARDAEEDTVSVPVYRGEEIGC